MNKFTKYVLGVLALVVIIGLGYYIIYKNPTTSKRESDSSNQIVGGDEDTNHCLGSAGYSWCEAKSKCLRVFEEFCPNAVITLVESIKNQTGVSFTNPENTEFDWYVNDGVNTFQKKISGITYKANSIHFADYEKIENYLTTNYTIDNYNVADGIVGGLRGYVVNYMACDLNYRRVNMKENSQGMMEPVDDLVNASLTCGYYNKNDAVVK
jgi:hypothetical protein